MSEQSLSDERVLPVASSRVTLRWVGVLLRPRAVLAILAAIAMIAAAVAGILVPVVIGQVVDVVVDGGTSGEILRFGVLLVALAVGGAGMTIVAELLVARFGEPAVAELRERVLDRALLMESGVVESSSSGDLLSRLSDDVRALSDIVRSVLVNFSGAALTVALSLGGLALIDYRLGLAAACAVPVQIWATRRYVRRAPEVYARIARAQGAESQQLLDSVGGSATVRSLGLSPAHRARIAERADTARRLNLAAVRFQTTFGQRLNFAEFVGVCAIVLVGYFLVDGGSVSEGEATAAALMFLRLFTPINIVLGLVDDVLAAFAGLARLVGVLEAPAEPVRADGPEPCDGGIQLRSVGFSYRPGHDVVHDVDLSIAAGESLAVVGSTGAGKSTLAMLIAGLRPPGSGEVGVGGVLLEALSPHQRRRAIAVVTQDVHVFGGPLREDLSLAAPDAGDDDLRSALDTVGALSWVETLSHGLDTVVGAGGHHLTPVQTQQLALARLVLADPAIAILDEATAEADSDGARLLEKAAETATRGRTTVVVAHRLSQASRCDRIAVMAAGRIVELGTHDELLARRGRYAELWDAWSAR